MVAGMEGSVKSIVRSARARKCFRELSLYRRNKLSPNEDRTERYLRCQQGIDIYCSNKFRPPKGTNRLNVLTFTEDKVWAQRSERSSIDLKLFRTKYQGCQSLHM